MVEYVLKPVNAEELTDILGRVRNLLDEEFAQRRNIAQLTEVYRKSLPLLREKFLQELLLGPMERGELERQIERFGMDIGMCAQQVVAVCEIGHRTGRASPFRTNWCQSRSARWWTTLCGDAAAGRFS